MSDSIYELFSICGEEYYFFSLGDLARMKQFPKVEIDNLGSVLNEQKPFTNQCVDEGFLPYIYYFNFAGFLIVADTCFFQHMNEKLSRTAQNLYRGNDQEMFQPRLGIKKNHFYHTSQTQHHDEHIQISI